MLSVYLYIIYILTHTYILKYIKLYFLFFGNFSLCSFCFVLRLNGPLPFLCSPGLYNLELDIKD